METFGETSSKEKKMNISRRVVVTGMGMVTPLGKDVKTTWENLLRRKNAVGKVSHFDASLYRTQIAAEINDFDPSAYLDPKEIKRLDLFAQYAIVAGIEAMNDAKLIIEKDSPLSERAGVFIGSGIGGSNTIQETYQKLRDKSPKMVMPHFIPMILINMPASQMSIRFNLNGPILGISTACASSGHSIGEAFHKIKYNYADVMLAGGAEASINPLPFAGFCAARTMSIRNSSPSTASRPFDKDRDGFVMGEGGAMVVLEDIEHAKKRGARIYAELCGYGTTADAYHITAPDPAAKGAFNAMKNALLDSDDRNAGNRVNYINAHGTSTPLNDKLETFAIKRLFGERAYKIPVSSTKSMIGHLLGASGAVEFITTVLSVNSGKIHPTCNLENPDPECDLDYVKEGCRDLEIDMALSNSFGFGGVNAALLVSKYKQ